MDNVMNSITRHYDPLQDKKHCQVFLYIMIIISLMMLMVFFGAIYEGLVESKPVMILATAFQLLVYLITFYVYRILYSMCVKAM